MRHYNNLVDARADLKIRGYSYDFNLKSHCLENKELDLKLHPEDFTISEMYRFEGDSSTPDDNSVLYAILSKDGIKGVVVDAYGPYAESITQEMARKLTFDILKHQS